MGQTGEVQRGDGFVALTIEEAVDGGMDGAVGGSEITRCRHSSRGSRND